MRRFSPLIILYLSFTFLAHPVSAQTTYNLRIEGSTQTYFNGQVETTDCVITDSAGTPHQLTNSAACGVVEAAAKNNFDYTFQDYGFGLFLTKIGTDDTPADFSKSWGFWLNDDSASSGLSGYAPAANDNILLAYSGYPGVPLRITVPADAKIGEKISVKIEKRTGTTDADWVWHGTWEPATGATLHINNLALVIPEQGIMTITLPEANNDLWADGDGFIRSAHLAFGNLSPTPSPTATPTPSATPAAATPLPTPTPAPETIDRMAAAKKALNFLRDKQSNDGSIEGITTTLWSAMAFGASEDRAETIKNGNASLLSSFLNTKPESATDIERLILALRAAGQNPRNYQGTDFVLLLKTKYHDNQFGETVLLNDDIFGILALLAADEPKNSDFLRDSVGALLKKQNSNGVWENLDLTAAAIQALKRYQQIGSGINVENNLARAKDYLKDHQDGSGGFGENSATTSWCIQAIVALGEDPSDWNNTDNNNPISALLSYQNTNGGFGWKNRDDVSAFMTAYAVPALLYAPLPITKLSMPNIEPAKVALISTSSPVPAASPKITHAITTPTATAATNFPNPSARRKNTGQVAGVEIIATPTPSSTLAPAPIQPAQKATENKSVFIFGLSFTNIGIGIFLTRLISKIRLIV